MTEREMYLGMAAWIREHGFSPQYYGGDCGCFYRAADTLYEPYCDMGLIEELTVGERGNCLYENTLSAAGWTGPEVTDDAVAACLIAADLAA